VAAKKFGVHGDDASSVDFYRRFCHNRVYEYGSRFDGAVLG
jgi:hypothetical protein